MIRQYALKCKIKLVRKTAGELYEGYGAEKREHLAKCPVCGSRGNCEGHGRYQRNIIDMRNGRVEYRRIEIKRVRCRSCGHTHGLLPDFIIPYTTYSLFFVLGVLMAYYRGRSVGGICRRFSITPSMLYQWKRIFLAHKELWEGVLKAAETAPEYFLRWLYHVTSYASSFAEPFFGIAACSFLQKHRDAARYRHAVI